MRWLAVAGLVLVAALATAGVRSGSGTAPPRPAAQPRVAGTPVAFTYLSTQRSNRCDLTAQAVMSLPDSARLQGSCCTRMDAASYRRQVSQLRRWRSISEIPADPYDIPASLAKRLLRLRVQTRLTGTQQRTYKQAMAASPEHGPCCCHCWRWEAFSGLSKDLIARRHWPARRVGTLIGALDGCGGKS